MFKQYHPFHCSGVLYLMRPSGAVSLTVLVFGGSLNMLVSITFPDLISLLCFPVQLHSISPAVRNSDSYINLLNAHWSRKDVEKEREKEGEIKAEMWRERKLTACVCPKKSCNMTKMTIFFLWINIRLWKMMTWKSMKPKWVWEVTLSTVCACLLVTRARWFCQAVRAERVRETTFATVLLL